MLNHDLADSPLASHRPDIEGSADSLRDFLREKFAEHSRRLHLAQTPADFQQLAFDLIDAALAEAGDHHTLGAGGSADDFLAGLLHQAQHGDRDLRMRSLCLLRLFGREGRSFQALADELGFKTRATPHKCYRDLQKQLGDVPSRGDKSPATREKCRQRRLGAKRETGSYFRTAFTAALRSLTPPPAFALN